MSRFVFKVAQLPPYLGTGLKLNAVTGLFDIDATAPQLLSGAILGGDYVLISRNIGTTAAPNYMPYYVTPAQIAALGGGSGAATTGTGSTTPTPTPTSSTIPADGTLSGLPTTIVAGQPLSAVAYSQPQTTVAFMLHRVATNANEGLSWISSTMPGNLNLLIPQNAGAYTVRSYAYPGPTNDPNSALLYESAQFAVTAAPGALPATPTQTADTGATATGVTLNWTQTAPSYRVLTRAGLSVPYGSLSDTTVSTNSYTYTGLAANSSPRAVVIPQNANGYGAPSGQFLSSTTA